MERNNENVIEWLTGETRILLTFTQQKHANLLKRLAEKYPDDVDVTINSDGSVFGHVPIRWLKISPPRQITDEQKEKFSERMASIRSNSNLLTARRN